MPQGLVDQQGDYFAELALKFGVPISEVWDVYDVFHDLDAEENGRLDVVQFRTMLTSVRAKHRYISMPRAYALLDFVATQSSDSLDFQDFLRWYLTYFKRQYDSGINDAFKRLFGSAPGVEAKQCRSGLHTRQYFIVAGLEY